MRRVLPAMLLAGILAACDRSKPAPPPVTKPEEQVRLFKTPDFEFLMPNGWSFLEANSQRDRAVFQSADGRSRLTLSILYLERDLTGEEARTAFTRFVELRRTAEIQPSSEIKLSDSQSGQGEGYWFSKWGGREPAADRRTGTLLTMEHKKLFTLFVESIGTSDEALNSLAKDVFGNFKAK